MESIEKLLPNFFFILLRAGIVIMMLPFFSTQSLPPQLKIGIAVAISLVIAPVVNLSLAAVSVPMAVVNEVLFGMALGMAARLIFFAVDMAGHLMATATGMSMATAFNPEIGPSSELSNVYSIISMLLFLAMDVHHDLIAVFVKSYELVPLGTMNAGGLVTAGVSFVSKIFIVALKLSAPVVIIMLVTNILLGFIYKAAPQMNVFFVGYPVYIFLGFLIMLLSLPVFAHVMGGYFTGIQDEMGRVMLLMKQ
jgi:flagellar biosynthetic protein FliR